MFSGIVDTCGQIMNIEKTSGGKRFYISCEYQDITQGESIAVDGVCLTAIKCDPGEFSCDVSPETLQLTRAKHLKIGDIVNLERSLCLSDRVSGHFVLGHVDQVCTLDSKYDHSEFMTYRFMGSNESARSFLVTKGSIAINGVSLTLNVVGNNYFEVMLIPETLKRTNLKSLEISDIVNIEYDYLAKLIANQVNIHSAQHD